MSLSTYPDTITNKTRATPVESSSHRPEHRPLDQSPETAGEKGKRKRTPTSAASRTAVRRRRQRVMPGGQPGPAAGILRPTFPALPGPDPNAGPLKLLQAVPRRHDRAAIPPCPPRQRSPNPIPSCPPFPLISSCQQAVYKGCTRDAHRMYQLKSHDLPVSIPCTPLVHGLFGAMQGHNERELAGWEAGSVGGMGGMPERGLGEVSNN